MELTGRDGQGQAGRGQHSEGCVGREGQQRFEEVVSSRSIITRQVAQ